MTEHNKTKFKTSVDVLRSGIKIDRDSFSIDGDYVDEDITDEELDALFDLVPTI